MSTPSPRPLALVTGASNGIGYEIARLCARGGFDLVATGRSAKIEEAAEQFTRDGAQVVPVRADLAETQGVETVWRAVEETGRPLAAAVLNAGRSIGGAFLDTDLDDELSLISLNVTSVVHLAKHVARHMAAHHEGRILITSSLSATLPTPYETVYGPSRAFTRMFALGLREELKEHGVTVTTLMPGATDSDFHTRAGMDNTAFGPGMKKNSRREVARQGFVAMMKGRAEVVGGDAATRRTAVEHRFLPETYKAARHATKARPRSGQPFVGRSTRQTKPNASR
ncbi:SDR family NAD(P)-dependent oxidoreductase [Streptomyces millisiae]|uniref:SDR family NAD(P)-dependent oxidoreductase n=1 Tax=Streptomyces millisiae TaxID=3075542 RepID=A0ABU2LHW9_9ACTN|nr:SDR family NAD(P)-dependent oxidoreductase [Streptomyces sp. DSM 44918]MDT0317162.1 SDR family NAD(P)-dependent oxidoreductase [Streptomyces sp. DSM 44918]